MEGYWLISYILLWLLVLCLAAVILAHSRLLGILHYRFGPSHAKPLADGPDLGTRLKDLAVERFDGSIWRWPFPAQQELLLVFISPQCQTCDLLVPHVKDLAGTHRDIQVTLMSTLEDSGMNHAFISYRNLSGFTYVNGVRLAHEFSIEGTPYALWADRDGVVQAKGLANQYEHLESLLAEGRARNEARTALAKSGEEQRKGETIDVQRLGKEVV